MKLDFKLVVLLLSEDKEEINEIGL